jgi:hypothetical protein
MTKRTGFRASTFVLPAVLLGTLADTHAVVAATQPAPAASMTEPAVAPQARDALSRMTAYLKSLQSFSVHEEITRDKVINGDLKVQKSSVAEVVVRKPDRARADFVADDDDRTRSVFYDGKTLTEYYPAKELYAQMAAPGTLGDALDAAQSRYGVEFPLGDFLRAASVDDLAKDLTSAGDVGKSRIGGADVEQFAYRTKEFDYQLWIENGEKALLRKIVITSKTRPSQPQFTAVLTWDLSPKIDDAKFAFSPPDGATKIPFGSPASAAPKPPAPQPHK